MLRALALPSSRQTVQTLGLAVIGSYVSTPSGIVLCEEKKSVLDTLLAKNKDGGIDWNGSLGQFTSPSFWDKVGKATGQQLQGAFDSGVPTQLSYGFVSGYCSGMALKKIGKIAAGMFGVGFLILQTLSYNGYVQVDHVKIQKQVENMMDLNADGKVDIEDGKLVYEKVLAVAGANLPAGSGFGAGFLGGLRSG